MPVTSVLKIIIGTIVAGLAFWVVSAAVPVAVRDTNVPTLREMRIPVAGLSREVTILHVTDLHSRWFGPGQSRVAALLKGRKVDAVVFTGDLMDGDADERELPPVGALVNALRPLTGEFVSVPGNHDFEQGPGELATMGVPTLWAGETTGIGKATGVYAVSADQDWNIKAPAAPGSRVLVVAMHQPPDAATLAQASRLTTGTVLVLAGHTHGGQIRLPGVGAVIAPPDWGFHGLGSLTDQVLPEHQGFMIDGAYRRGRAWIDVSPGLGTSKLPFRLNDPAEVTLIRLVPA